MLFFCHQASFWLRRKEKVRRDSALKIVKVFNNNSVSVILPGGREAILLGNGIGFHKRSGESVDEQRVEKVYYVQTEMQTKFLEMLQDVQPDVMEAAERIIALAEAEGFTLSSQGTISLVDHITFAIERQERQLSLPNLLLSETRLLYQKEYALGRKALEIIREQCGISLPEDEAGYIALHLVSISVDSSAAYGTLKFVKAMLDIIRSTYRISLDEASLDALRLITHLKVLSQRVQQGTPWQDGTDDALYDYLLKRNPANSLCLQRIDSHLREIGESPLNPPERFYLLIHLNRVLEKSK